MTDAERHGPHVRIGHAGIEQIGDDLRLPGREHLFGNLAAGRERGVGEHLLCAAARQLELERAVGAGQHDEGPLGAGDLDRRVQDQGQHVLQDPARSRRAEPRQERRDLAQVIARAGHRSPRQRPPSSAVSSTRSAPPPRPRRTRSPGPQVAFGHRVAVEERAVARLAVAQNQPAAVEDDLGVLARHLAAREAQIVAVTAANAERKMVERDLTLTRRIVYMQSRPGHRPQMIPDVIFQRAKK